MGNTQGVKIAARPSPKARARNAGQAAVVFGEGDRREAGRRRCCARTDGARSFRLHFDISAGNAHGKACGRRGRDVECRTHLPRAGWNARSPAAGLVARHERDRHRPGLHVLLQLDAGEKNLASFVGFGVAAETGIELANGRGLEDGEAATAGLLSVLIVVGIGPGGVVREYMCQSGSTVASRRPRTTAPGAAVDGSSVNFHCTWLNFSLCAEATPQTKPISSNRRVILNTTDLTPLLRTPATLLRCAGSCCWMQNPPRPGSHS